MTAERQGSDMCEVYSIATQKGGCSKTTSSVNLGIGLARQGYRVLMIDSDPQGSLSSCLGVKEPDSLEITLATVMGNEMNEEPYDASTLGIIHHEEGVDFMPCNIELSGMELSLISTWSREMLLSRYIEKVRKYYDYIIIDCMSSLSLMTVNVFAAADKVIIPVQAAYLPVKGLEQLLKTIKMVRTRLNPRLEIAGILITMFDRRTRLAKDTVSILQERYGEMLHIYESVIPYSVKAAEESEKGVSIYKHAPRCAVAEAYRNLTEEVLRYEG